MPAIITHDLFGKDVYGETFDTIGGSRDAAEAFLLGNQGPDPLFFVAPDPRYRRAGKLASTLHRARPAEFLVALKSAVRELPAQERSVGRAYALGYVCHYLLDSTVHPLVISQVNALCAAGVEGLAAEDAHEVHAVIETELDELVLTAKRGETVATYHPATSVLRGRDSMLDTVGRLYATAIDDAFGLTMPKGMFKSAVRAERAAQRALYSPTGAKRAVLSAAEPPSAPLPPSPTTSARPGAIRPPRPSAAPASGICTTRRAQAPWTPLRPWMPTTSTWPLPTASPPT